MLTAFSFRRPFGKKNFGDDVSRELIEYILRKPVVWQKQYKADINGIGSNLQSMATARMQMRFSLRQLFGKKSYIWGSGNISNEKISLPHKNILALRGPLTHKTIENIHNDQNIIYGDPGILFGRYWPKLKPISFNIGLVLHYKDCHLYDGIRRLYPEIKVIRADQSPATVLEEISMCGSIMSSSLHGLVAADSYQIPNMKVEFNQPLKGGDFKFEDYALGVNRSAYKTYRIFNLADIRLLVDEISTLCTLIDASMLELVCDRLENCLKDALN